MKRRVGKVPCEITRSDRAVFLRCTRCDNRSAAEGTDDQALKKAYARLRSSCRENVQAFYVSADVYPPKTGGKWTLVPGSKKS